jgi:Kef-type K+ transport system membrane component KefB
MSNSDFTHLLLAIAHLLVAAHAGGYVFNQLRLPRVIGEICGGFVLGPTVLGYLSPDWFGTVFAHSPSKTVLETLSKISLMLLMFCSGLEIRSQFSSGERRTAGFITLTGTIIPFAVALSMGAIFDFSSHYGGAANPISFNLVVAIAVAVTSIPVISKIMMDLGILNTAFARIVLAAAIVEDICLYVVLSVAITLAVPLEYEKPFSLAHRIGVPDGSWLVLYHVGVTLVFFVLALTFGPKLYRRSANAPFNFLRKSSSLGYLLFFLITFSGFAMFLEVELMFGAFLAGVVVGMSSESGDEALAVTKSLASAFFIPLFFAMVGFRLNLLHDVPWLFLLAFFMFACVIKSSSVYAGARWAGIGSRGAWSLAVAMNARGGPGIVLASVALDAHIINEGFYVCIVLLAIVTSLMAGIWLSRAERAGGSLL